MTAHDDAAAETANRCIALLEKWRKELAAMPASVPFIEAVKLRQWQRCADDLEKALYPPDPR